MKTILVFCIAAVLGFCGCSEESTSPVVGAGSMSAKIDGADWSASLTIQATYQSGVVAIAGQDGQIRQVQLRILNPEGTGDYPVGSKTTITLVTGTSQSDMYVASIVGGSGTVNFSKLTSTEAEGTFSFTARNTAGGTKSVSDGKFSVKF